MERVEAVMIDRTKPDRELAALNAEVEASLAKRKDWMDAHMPDYARSKADLRRAQLHMNRYWTKLSRDAGRS